MASGRPYDIVVYGATGFAGRLVCRHLAGVPSLKWAIAGRTAAKLEVIQAELNAGKAAPPVDVIVASSSDPASLGRMAGKTRVVLSTVGPFMQYGEPLVAACVANGTDYADITGESPWVAAMIERYDAAARSKGVCLVPMSGFDSVPSDVGTWLCMERAAALRRRVTSVRSYFTVRGSASGGTVASGLGLVRLKHIKALRNPTLLCPPDTPKGAIVPHSEPVLPGKALGRVVGPFPMSTVNSHVVRRTAALRKYPAPFSYREYSVYPSFLVACVAALSMLVLPLLVLVPCTRWAMKPLLPKPGTGPSEAKRKQSSFQAHVVATLAAADGTSASNDTVRAVVAGKDPGYDETAVMLAEAGLALAFQRDELPGVATAGFLTPASCFGGVLVERLRHAGMTLEVHDP